MEKTKLDSETISEKTRLIIADILKIDKTLLLTESRFSEDLGADSLDKITLLMALEDEFGTTIPDTDAKMLLTVGAVEEYIKNHFSSQLSS